MVLRPLRDLGWRRLRALSAAPLALALTWAVAGTVLVHGYQRARDQGQRQSALYARVLEDHANRTFGALEVTLGATASRLEALSAQPTAALGTDAVLAEMTAGQAFLRSLSLVGPDGSVLASSQAPNAGVQLEGELWRALLADARRETAPHLRGGRDLADASLLPGPHHQVLLLARPLSVAEGQPARWLVAALNPDFFANQYELLLDDGAWLAALVTLDGALLASTTNLPVAPGQPWAHAPWQRQAASSARGDIQGPGIGNDDAVGSWRVLRQLPLVVVSQAPERYVMADWQRELQQVLLAAGLATAAIAATARLNRREREKGRVARAEQESAQRQLREHYEMTEQLVDAMPLPVFLTDLEANLLLANRAWVEWLGLDQEAPPAGQDTAQSNLLDTLLAQGTHEVASAGVANWPLQLPTRGGGVREAVLTKVAMRANRSGQVTGVIGTMIDVTEYKQAQRATERARVAAEASGQARTEFVANVTHELRTPLQSIIGFAELGQSRADGQERLAAMFKRIEGAGQRMLRLVEDLLDVSRIGSTVGSVQPRPGCVTAAVVEVVDELRALAGGRGLTLRYRAGYAAAETPVMLDVQRFQQVTRNVVANAIRFAPIDSTIDIETHIADGMALTTVRDQGPGVPEDELQAIFEPFVQSSRTKDGSGGTGLGLAICRQILEGHGGFIDASNHPQGGALFRWAVPLVPLTQGAASD
jgi:PAS domain S-box-containing protein